MFGTKAFLRKNSVIFLAVIGIAFSGFTAPSVHAQTNNSDCTLEFDEPADLFNYALDDTLEFSSFERNNGEAKITVTNNSECELPLTLASYEMTSSGVLSDQSLHADTSLTVDPGSTRTISIDMPSCMSQIDLLSNPDQNGAPENPSFANPNLIGYTYNGNQHDNFAENDIFHFSEDNPYNELDNYPDDKDDRPADAQPADGFNFCDQQSDECQADDGILPIDEPADLFNYALDDTLEFSAFTKNNGDAEITVTNNSNCELPLTLASYEMTSSGVLSDQTLHADNSLTVEPGNTRTIGVTMPSCMSQVDLLSNPNQDGAPENPSFANPNLIGYTYNGNQNDIFAENDIFHFSEDSPYSELDEYPDDEDDRPADAQPADGFNFCDQPSDECEADDGILPIDEPADLFDYALDGTLEFSSFQKNNGNTAITVTNNSNCELPLALGVYEMYDNNFTDQELFSQDQATISPDGGTATLESELPSCMAQIDLLYNPDGTNPPETPSSANPDVIGFTFHQNEEDTFAENDIFHFSEDSPYSELDNYPDDEDDSPNNAGPEANFCSDDPEPQPVSCPFVEGEGDNQYDHVITFSNEGLRSDQGESAAKTEKETLVLESGEYDVGLFASDQHTNRSNQTQAFEQYFVRFTDSETDFAEATESTNDLEDEVVTATTTHTETIALGQQTNSIQARHSSFFGKVGDDGTANSLSANCVGIDKQDEPEPDPLTGSCSASPDPAETGQTVTWEASAEGGQSPYSFSWNLEGKSDGISGQSVETMYDNEGDFSATTTISDQDGNTISRTCNVSIDNSDDDGGGGVGGGGGVLPPRDDEDGDVAGAQDPEFSVQCQADKPSYLVGQRASFTADIDGDIDAGNADYRWASTEGNNLRSDQENASLQFTSPGQKEVGVRVDYENTYEIAKCSVIIEKADSGVSLDEVPYTGPGDTARMIAFFVLLGLLAITAGYLIVRRLRKGEIHVGIPHDHRN